MCFMCAVRVCKKSLLTVQMPENGCYGSAFREKEWPQRGKPNVHVRNVRKAGKCSTWREEKRTVSAAILRQNGKKHRDGGKGKIPGQVRRAEFLPFVGAPDEGMMRQGMRSVFICLIFVLLRKP